MAIVVANRRASVRIMSPISRLFVAMQTTLRSWTGRDSAVRKPRVIPSRESWNADALEPIESLDQMPTDRLLYLLRIYGHRLEKSYYNRTTEAKREYYAGCKDIIATVAAEVARRDRSDSAAAITDWAQDIVAFFDEPDRFVRERCSDVGVQVPPTHCDVTTLAMARRSVRIWASIQPSPSQLRRVAIEMISIARWAPNSSNRQAWRFALLESRDELEILRGVKEEHLVGAPLVIFCGMDRRLYPASDNCSPCLYFDAGVAIMQMVLFAQYKGLGTCINYFARDFIESRDRNVAGYSCLSSRLGIPDYVEPVALISIGQAGAIQPAPRRVSVKDVTLEI